MKAKRKNGFMNSLSRFLKFNDTTGYPVSLTYKGSHSYKSVIGGILSLMTKFLVLAYFIYQLQLVFTHDRSVLTYQLNKRDLSDIKKTPPI